MLIAALSIFLLVMTSSAAQWLLASPPFKFLGKISYTLYLVHTLIIEWPIKEISKSLVDGGMSYDGAAYLNFFIWTPVLILFAWLCEWGIDTPAKNFANLMDQAQRADRPKPRKGEEAEEEPPTCWSFSTSHWQVWAIFGYLAVLLIITEIYKACNGNREKLLA